MSVTRSIHLTIAVLVFCSSSLSARVSGRSRFASTTSAAHSKTPPRASIISPTPACTEKMDGKRRCAIIPPKARSVTPFAFSNDFTIDTTTTNLTDQMLGLCANNCYAATTAFSTVPYYTLDTPRNLTLVYNEDRAHPRPVIFADVAPVSGSVVPSYYTLAATLNGTSVPFLNGDYTSYFNGSSNKVRLAQQFDASSYTTGIYTLTVTVSAVISGTTYTHSYTRPLAIVNEAHSPIARGWTIAGVQRLYINGSNYLITDGIGNAVTYFSASTGQGADYSTLQVYWPGWTYVRTYLDGSSVAFNSSGEMISTIDRLGFSTTFTYDSLGRLTQIVDPTRNTLGITTSPYLQLSYNATYGLSAIQEMGGPGGAGRKTAITLGSDSTLQSITDPGGGHTSYAYDASKRLSHIINRHGDTTTYQYDAHSWKMTEEDLPRVPVDAGGGATITAIPKIKDTPWITMGVPTTPTSLSARGIVWTYPYINSTITDPMGHTTTITVDRWGQPVSITDPGARITTITRSGMLPVKIAYPSGGIDTMAYALGTPLVTYLKTAGDSVVNYHYSGGHNQVDSVWGAGQWAERRFLDSLGRIDSIRYASSDSVKVRYAYDAYNRVTSRTDPEGHTVSYYYDPVFGNMDSTSGPGHVGSVLRMDAFGRDTATRMIGSPVWQHNTYDTLNRVRKSWHPGILNDTTIVVYDSLYPVSVRVPGGLVYKLAYNALGWPTGRYNLAKPDTTLYTSLRYDTAGRLTSSTNARGQEVDMTYDALDRLLTRTISGTLADTFSYSTSGLIVRATRKNVTRDSVFLNLAGQADSIIRGLAGHRYAIHYSFSDTTNRSKRLFWISSDVSIPWSEESDIVHSQLSAVDTVALTGAHEAGSSWILHNSDGDPYEIRWPDLGHAKLWFLTSLHQPTEMYPYYNNITTLVDSLGRVFTYDSLGRVSADHRWYNGHTIPGRNFVYDSLGQLLKVVSVADSVCSTTFDSLALAFTYTCSHPASSVTQDSAQYDAKGNRKFLGATYDTVTNYLLTGPSGVSYTYDYDGNMVTRTHGGVTDSLFWSALGLLDSVASGGSTGLRHIYEYDGFGQLVRRQTKVGSGAYSVDRYFLWDENQLIAELAYPGTHRIAQYIYNGGTDQPFALITDSASTSKVRFFYPDPIEGNLMGIMRDTATLHQYTQYGAWGEILARPINVLADTNRLGWKGLMYEGDSTRLYYVRGRWYDPAVGRFVSQDPLGLIAGPNLYTFAGNDPINGADPSGMCNFFCKFVQFVFGGGYSNGGDDGYVNPSLLSHTMPNVQYDARHMCPPDLLFVNCNGGNGQDAPNPGPPGRTAGSDGVFSAGVDGDAFWGVGGEFGIGVNIRKSGLQPYLRVGGGFGADIGAGGELSPAMQTSGTVDEFCGTLVISVCASKNVNTGQKSGSVSYAKSPKITEDMRPLSIGVHVERARTWTGPTIPWQQILPYILP